MAPNSKITHNVRHRLEDEVADTEYLLSEESLKCLPDYNQRLEVLTRLNYIDEHKRVRLKGKRTLWPKKVSSQASSPSLHEIKNWYR